MSKVLVAEPDAFFCKFYALKLKQLGHEVNRVEDGKKAMELLNKDKYDLILMNIMLPFQDGYTILRNLKEGQNISTPVVVITELSQEEDKKKAMDLGVIAYFTKTDTQIQDLLKALEPYLSHSEASQEPPQKL
ncbi:MAG: response regulator, partial [Candidatus Gracilibacteria bacterium]|nr:response regulator [bacterium]MDZ4217350.1 response regulator [Candidatus Gracilibacteria bacterium]